MSGTRCWLQYHVVSIPVTRGACSAHMIEKIRIQWAVQDGIAVELMIAANQYLIR